jgi:hypothetical protein
VTRQFDERTSMHREIADDAIFQPAGGTWQPIEESATGTHFHRFGGSDSAFASLHARAFRSIEWTNAESRVRLTLEDESDRLAIEVHAATPAALARLTIALPDVESLEPDSDCPVRVRLASGDDLELSVGGPFALALSSPAQIGFRQVGGAGLPVVMTGALQWASYFGGSGQEWVKDVAVDSKGRVVIAGLTSSPFTGSPWLYGGGVSDAFVARLRASGGALDFFAYLGGNGEDIAEDVAVELDDGIAVAGTTGSTSGFPVTLGAFDTTPPSTLGVIDTFIARLSPDGASLRCASLLGGGYTDYATGMAVDALGQITVVGFSKWNSIPTTPGAFDPGPASSDRPYVARFTADATALVFATYCGGTTFDSAIDMALAPDGSVYFVGGTASGDFPFTPGAYLKSTPGLPLAVGFVCHLSADGTSLLQATGLESPTTYDNTYLHAIALTPDGRPIVLGTTSGLGFPTTPGAYGTTPIAADFCISRFSADLSQLEVSTLIDGPDTQEWRVGSIACDSSGMITALVGQGGNTFPMVPGTFQALDPGGLQLIVFRMSPDLGTLLYSSKLGGFDNEYPGALALADPDTVVAVGMTGSTNMPITPGAYQTSAGGGSWDGYVAKLDLLPFGTRTFGAATPACHPDLSIGPTKQPQAGDAQFGVFSSSGPASAIGVLAIGAGAVPSGVPLLGITVYLDLAQPFMTFPALSDQDGWCSKTVPIPAGSSGLTVFAQFAWLGTASCGGVGTLSSTNVLEFEIQP